MDGERGAAVIGSAACLLVVALTGLPYAVIDRPAVAVYYRAGIVGPPLIALFALIAAIVLLAGVTDRTDPPLAAGVAVVIGLFMVGLAWTWALDVSAAVVGGLTDIDSFQYHRWAIAITATVAAAAGGWYARSVV